MEWVEDFENLTQGQKLFFQRVCRKLLKMTFIVKEKSSNQREDYYFVKKYSDIFSGYFNMIGYDAVVNEISGVVMLVNCSRDDEGIQANRFRLKFHQSIVLCCLWILYAERMASGSLSTSIIVPKAELDTQLDKLGYSGKIDKKSMDNILRLFAEYNLIEVIGKITDSDCEIKLFTSMQFCMSDEEFRRFVEITIPKMKASSTVAENEDIADVDEDDDNE